MVLPVMSTDTIATFLQAVHKRFECEDVADLFDSRDAKLWRDDLAQELLEARGTYTAR
jgi:hypothetical protein